MADFVRIPTPKPFFLDLHDFYTISRIILKYVIYTRLNSWNAKEMKCKFMLIYLIIIITYNCTSRIPATHNGYPNDGKLFLQMNRLYSYADSTQISKYFQNKIIWKQVIVIIYTANTVILWFLYEKNVFMPGDLTHGSPNV